jgi:hypothetical protein
MEAWTPVITTWGLNDIQSVDDINRVENNLKHLKEKECTDFDILGDYFQTGHESNGWWTDARSFLLFSIVKIIPARTTLYLKEVSKWEDATYLGVARYVTLALDAAKTYPANVNLNWFTAPDTTGIVESSTEQPFKTETIRWISTKPSTQAVENFYFADTGLKLVSNPLYVDAYVSFVGRVRATNLSIKSGVKDTLYMHFHMEYDDI